MLVNNNTKMKTFEPIRAICVLTEGERGVLAGVWREKFRVLRVRAGRS
jgi:hypothetical protein